MGLLCASVFTRLWPVKSRVVQLACATRVKRGTCATGIQPALGRYAAYYWYCAERIELDVIEARTARRVALATHANVHGFLRVCFARVRSQY